MTDQWHAPWHRPGYPDPTDPEVLLQLESMDAATDEERLELNRRVVQASLAYRRTRNPQDLTGWREAVECPPGDEAELERHMDVVRTLLPGERRALLWNMLRTVIAYERTGDQEHLEDWRTNVFASLRLRRCPEYVQAVRNSARPPRTERADAPESPPMTA